MLVCLSTLQYFVFLPPFIPDYIGMHYLLSNSMRQMICLCVTGRLVHITMDVF